MTKRFVLIGPTPPPLGGVSVYMRRLTQQLRAQGNRVTNFDFTQAGFGARMIMLFRILMDPRPVSYELHAFDFSVMAVLLLRPFAKTISYMDHATAVYQRDLSGLRKMILGKLFTHAGQISFVSEEGRQFYVRAGYVLPADVVIRHAFIAPSLNDEPGILETYPADTREFMDRKSPLIVANASQLIFYNGTDLYGMDLCVQLTERLIGEFPNVGFLFALGNENFNREYLERTRRELREKGLSDAFEILGGQREMWPVFRRADLMIRPTVRDGYAISIEEALYCGCATLASDAARRPDATQLFRNRDIDDLERQARGILSVGPLRSTRN